MGVCVCFAWFWGHGLECGLVVKIIRRICDCLSMFVTMEGVECMDERGKEGICGCLLEGFSV